MDLITLIIKGDFGEFTLCQAEQGLSAEPLVFAATIWGFYRSTSLTIEQK
ncbi:MAG: hypothetical protein K1563_13970 [Candidatus Thiodiazotropha sp. (ex. Lucinisca nassula)]|nr:hypothetical protein [Candidatus Thiodiazotropha sp. (ex. Lucinisca nassula)]